MHHKANQFQQNVNHYINGELKDTLSQAKVTIELCTLALFFSLIVSAVIIVFRLVLFWLTDFTQPPLTELSESLTDWRILLPIFGALSIWGMAKIGSKRYKRLGIPYVLHRIKHHYGKVPLQSAPAQFFQALFALICNFSVGKEGPAIHLGAVTASVIAKKLKLPDNSVRILSASGIAAGIAAIFNSPLAALIFVFEVILKEYKFHYFFPVMIAAVCGAFSSQLIFGDIHEFDNIQSISIPLSQYPILAITGVILGGVAAGFNRTLIFITRKGYQTPLFIRLMLAGTITAVIGLLIPEAIGSSHSVIEYAINEHAELTFLLLLLIAKIIATIAALGLGVPGGVIGPLFGIGALVGAILSIISTSLSPVITPYIGLYTIIGMTIMMGVCLGAPLASLIALLELTNNTMMIMPAMFVSVPAFLVAQQFFHSKSLFHHQLDAMGLAYKISPVMLGLQKHGVRSLMNKQIQVITHDELPQIPHDNDTLTTVLVQSTQGELYRATQYLDHTTTVKSKPIEGLQDTATLAEVYNILSIKRCGEVFIYQKSKDNVVGLISWSSLQKQLKRGED